MNAEQLNRWNNAKTLVQSLKDTASIVGGEITYYNEPIPPEHIVVTESEITVQNNEDVIWVVFSTDPQWDDGLYTTCAEFEARFRSEFAVIKQIPY